MHVITRSRLIQFRDKHPNAETSLRLWYKVTSLAQWQNLAELHRVFPSASQVGNLTVFNVGGNKYRLIALVDYKHKKVFIRHVLTHGEYDKDNWKNDQWFM